MKASYIEICFACVMNYFNLVWSGEEYSYGVIINNVYLFFCTILIAFFPIWVLFFLKKNYEKLPEDEFKEKYDVIYEGSDLNDNKASIWVPVIYCLRRLAMCLACCLLIGYPVFQFATMFASHLVEVMFLGAYHPYDNFYQYK